MTDDNYDYEPHEEETRSAAVIVYALGAILAFCIAAVIWGIFG